MHDEHDNTRTHIEALFACKQHNTTVITSGAILYICIPKEKQIVKFKREEESITERHYDKFTKRGIH